MKGRALALVLLLLIALLSAVSTVPAEDGGDRSPGEIRVRLYAQLSATGSSLSTEQSSSNFRLSDSLDFPSIELAERLTVMAVPTDIGKNDGLEARIGVQANVLDTRVTVQVRDDDTVIANKTISIPRGETRWDWRLPFVTSKDSHTFARRHQITLRITADRPVFIRTDSASYLELLCVDHLSVDVETKDVDERRTSEFYPNDLSENRHVLIVGDVSDPFGGGDIARVNVSVKKPNGAFAVENAAATVTDMNYTYDWSYASGLPAGSYSINVTATDLQGHACTAMGALVMSDYGILISAEGEESGVVTGDTTPGVKKGYVINILNIGGKSANVRMDYGAPINLWQSSFSRDSFTLAAGDDEDVTFSVTPSAVVGGGNFSSYVVTATVNNDPAVPKAKDTLTVETYVRDDVRLEISPEDPDPRTVGVGKSVDHIFTLKNAGEFDTTVDISYNNPPTGWSAQLVGDDLTGNTVELQKNQVVDITLRVTAPTSSDRKKATITVTCRARDADDIEVSVTFETRMVIGLRVNPTSPLTYTRDPTDSFTIWFDAWNPDPTGAHDATFTVEQDGSSWPSTSFKFSPSNLVRLEPSPDGTDKEAIALEVTIPESAEADDYRFTVRGQVDNNQDVYVSFDFNVTINIRHELEVRTDTGDTLNIKTDDFSYTFLEIENKGNVVEEVNITVDVESKDIEVEIQDVATRFLFNLEIEPGATEQIKIGFKASDESDNNEEITVRISVISRSDPTTPNEPAFKLKVELTTAEQFIDFFTIFGVLILMLIGMFALLVIKPGRRAAKRTEEDEEEDAQHGAMVRT